MWPDQYGSAFVLIQENHILTGCATQVLFLFLFLFFDSNHFPYGRQLRVFNNNGCLARMFRPVVCSQMVCASIPLTVPTQLFARVSYLLKNVGFVRSPQFQARVHKVGLGVPMFKKEKKNYLQMIHVLSMRTFDDMSIYWLNVMIYLRLSCLCQVSLFMLVHAMPNEPIV